MSDREHKILLWKLERNSGKVDVEFAKISNSITPVPKNHFLYVIHRAEVEAGDFARLRHEFSLELPPKKLREMLGNTTFAIAGYEDVDKELYEIEEVRDYLHEIHCHYPCYLAFAAHATGTMRWITACIADWLHVVKRADEVETFVAVPRPEVTAIFVNAIPLTGAFHRTVGISPRKGRKILEAAAEHLGMLDA